MRAAGILMHISSLPSKYGIGTLGEEARHFVDFLKKAGQKYWQVLPIGPTSYGDSPYQSFSSFAGNPYFIDPEILIRDGFLERKEADAKFWGESPERTDYGALYQYRFPLLRKAVSRIEPKLDYRFEEFLEKNKSWLPDYALFMAIKDRKDGISWMEWEKPLKFREPEAIEEAKQFHAEDIRFYEILQFLFYQQWNDLKTYANQNGIRLIGDIPIYVAFDSADLWTDPKEFELDEDLSMIHVAGCPPDAFCEVGQLWGNPLYRWDKMEQDGFSWWVNRIASMVKLFDLVRIDHFRGFDQYYAVPAKDDTARNGKWQPGPGIRLFETLKKELGDLPIIAEDLGFLTPSVYELMKKTGFPGMKVLQFAFDSRNDSEYLPHNHPTNCVVYTGTHDNETILGWMESAPKESVEIAKEYLGLSKEEGCHWGMMRGAWSSVAELSIVTMQDLLGLGREARMNEPSTMGKNWKWRMRPGALTDELAEKLAEKMKLYGR